MNITRKQRRMRTKKIGFEGYIFRVDDWEDWGIFLREGEWDEVRYVANRNGINPMSRFIADRWAKDVTPDITKFLQAGKKYRLTVEEVE